jgi:uncharacterized damage-inducible protein DinB
MKLRTRTGVLLLSCSFACSAALAQQAGPGGPPPGPAGPPTITSVLQTQLGIEEHEIEGLAQAMPEDKYSFAPTNGNFAGVRTFAQQVKHIATVNDRFFNSILGQAATTPGSLFEAENGPNEVQSKAQILQYLQESFALGHKAIATINADNAFVPMKTPPTPFLHTPAAVAVFDCAHAMDHYGQMVEYARDNGLTPPASANRQPANPPAAKQ